MTRAAIPPLLKHLNERTVLRDDPQLGADLARGDLAAGGDLEADGLARAPVPARRRPRPRDGRRARPPAVRRGLLRAGPGRRARPRPRPRRAVPARGDLRPGRHRAGPPGRGASRTSRSDSALEAIAKLRTSLVDASGLPAHLLDSAVVGVPAVVDDATGQLSMATNVPGLEGRDFRADLVERLGLPVTLDNDINLAARGEQWRGVARRGRGLRLPLGGHRARRRARPPRRAPPRPERRRRRGRPRRLGAHGRDRPVRRRSRRR